MLTKMAKVEIVGPQKYFSRAIDLLYALGVIHLEGISESVSHRNSPVNDLAMSASDQEERKTLQELYARLNGLLLLLPDIGFDRSSAEKWEGKEPNEIFPDLDDAEKKIREATDRKVAAEEKSAVINRYRRILEVFSPMVASIKGSANFDMTGVTIRRDQRQVIPLLKAQLSSLTKGEYELFTQDVDKDTTAVLILYNRNFADKINNLLYQRQISEIALPADLRDKPFHEALLSLQSLQETLPQQILNVQQDLTSLAGKYRTKAAAARQAVLDKLNKYQAYNKFGSTKYTFVICGWVPSAQLQTVGKRFEKVFGKDVIINKLEMREEEQDKVPVALNNISPVRPFEVLLSFLGLPKYGSIDPTPIMAIFFPLFFGMILGDVGYGLIALMLGIFLKAKFKNPLVKNVSIVVIVASLFTIAFGVIYGEYFGDFGHKVLHLKPLWKDRTDPEAVIALLILTVAIGAFHVILGYILGIIEAVREKSAHHIVDKVAMLVALAGVFFLLGSWGQVDILPKQFFSTGIVFLIISIPVLIYAQGFIAPLEVISSIGNMLSYARIMAIGLSSAVLAMVANKFGGIIGNILLAALVVLLMHTLNLVLGLFSPTIHSLRLHYVEFFNKFYKSGGVRYTPFSRTGGSSS